MIERKKVAILCANKTYQVKKQYGFLNYFTGKEHLVYCI